MFNFRKKDIEIEKVDNEEKIKVNNEYDLEKKQMMEFLEKMKNELEEVINQHQTVNSHHSALAELTKQISSQMEYISGLSKNNNQSADFLKDKSNNLIKKTKETVNKSSDGKASIEELMGIVQNLETETNVTYKSMSTLNQSIEKIDQIVSVIRGIANQTNLLALNASIEAARAGEEGRGFAVVAEEVRKLAEMTADSTSNISALIGNVTEQTQVALLKAENSAKIVSQGTTVSRQALEKIEEILSGFGNVEKDVMEFIGGIEEQKSNSEKILGNIESIEDILGETKDLLLSHVESARKVDVKLENAVKQIKKY